MDFINNLVTSLKNYFSPQQEQAPVNAIQPGQGPVAPVQQSIDYSQVLANNAPQQIVLPEIQLPQIQTGGVPFALAQQNTPINYNNAIAGQPIIPLPTIDFNAVASQPITQAQPFQLGTQQQVFEQAIQQPITQAQPFQLGTPEQYAQGAQILQDKQVQDKQIQEQGVKDIQQWVDDQEQKKVFFDKQIETNKKETEIAQQPINDLIQQEGEQGAINTIQQNIKKQEDDFYGNFWGNVKDSKGLIGGIETAVVGAFGGIERAYGGQNKRQYAEAYTIVKGKKLQDLPVTEGATLNEIKLYGEANSAYKKAAQPIIDVYNKYISEVDYKIKNEGFVPDTGKVQILKDATDSIDERVRNLTQTIVKNGGGKQGERVAINELVKSGGYTSLNEYLKGGITGASSILINSANVSPEDALKIIRADITLTTSDSIGDGAKNAGIALLDTFSIGVTSMIKGIRGGVKRWNEDVDGEISKVTGIAPTERNVIGSLFDGSETASADISELGTIGGGLGSKIIATIDDVAPELIAAIYVDKGITKLVGGLGKLNYILSPATKSARNFNTIAKAVNNIDWIVGSQVQNAVIDTMMGAYGDERTVSMALNPAFDLIFGKLLDTVLVKPLSLDINKLVDGDYTESLKRSIAIDNLNKRLGDNVFTSKQIADEVETIKNVTPQQVDDYKQVVESSFKGLKKIQKEAPEQFNKIFKMGAGEQLMLGMLKSFDGTEASKFKLTGLLNDIANVNIGTAEMVGRALGTGGIIHAMDGSFFNPFKLDPASYNLGIQTVPNEVLSHFGYNPASKSVDVPLLESFASQRGIDTADMVDIKGNLTIEGVSKLGITLDAETLAKYARGDEQILVREIASRTGASQIEAQSAIKKIHNIIGDIVC